MSKDIETNIGYRDLMSKIESGYKVQIRELKEKLEAVNGDNNITQEKSS